MDIVQVIPRQTMNLESKEHIQLYKRKSILESRYLNIGNELLLRNEGDPQYEFCKVKYHKCISMYLNKNKYYPFSFLQ